MEELKKLCPNCERELGNHTHLEYQICAEKTFDSFVNGDIEIKRISLVKEVV